MRVLAVGVESSGTRLLARLLAESPDVDAVHRSVPHGQDWWRDPGELDAAVIIMRSWRHVIPSQMRNGHMDIWAHMSPHAKLRLALERMVIEVARLGVPFNLVTYADVVAEPQATMDDLWAWLGARSTQLGEAVYDGNHKEVPCG